MLSTFLDSKTTHKVSLQKISLILSLHFSLLSPKCKFNLIQLVIFFLYPSALFKKLVSKRKISEISRLCHICFNKIRVLEHLKLLLIQRKTASNCVLKIFPFMAFEYICVKLIHGT